MTCQACREPLAGERSYGRFHWRCVERLVSATRRRVAA